MPVCRLIFTPTAPHCGHTVCTASEQWILLARVSTVRTEWRTPQCRSISAAAKAAPRKLTSRRMLSCSSVRHLIRASLPPRLMPEHRAPLRPRRPLETDNDPPASANASRLNVSSALPPDPLAPVRARAPAHGVVLFLVPVMTLRCLP